MFSPRGLPCCVTGINMIKDRWQGLRILHFIFNRIFWCKITLVSSKTHINVNVLFCFVCFLSCFCFGFVFVFFSLKCEEWSIFELKLFDIGHEPGVTVSKKARSKIIKFLVKFCPHFDVPRMFIDVSNTNYKNRSDEINLQTS